MPWTKNYDLMLECLIKLQTHATQKELDDICMVLTSIRRWAAMMLDPRSCSSSATLAMIRKFDGERLR